MQDHAAGRNAGGATLIAIDTANQDSAPATRAKPALRNARSSTAMADYAPLALSDSVAGL